MTRSHNGLYLIAIGSLHQLVGLLIAAGLVGTPESQGRNVLAELVRGGLADDPLRIAFFWFFFFGFLLLVLGSLVRSAETQGLALPRALGVQLGALALAGGALMPASGFWLVLPIAWRIAGSAQPARSLTRSA